jgi:dTDP-L-rhamnose 4-epimerase
MKILITGGAGFIGSHIVDACATQGFEVVCVDSLDAAVHSKTPDYLRSDVEYSFADLREWQPGSSVEDVQAIVHLAALGGVTRAAREPANVIDANCRGTARLVEWASRLRNLKSVIVAGSFSVYGSNYEYACPGCGMTSNGARDESDLAKGRYEVYCRTCNMESQIVPITESASPSPLETYGASKYMQELCFRGFNGAPVTILRFSSVYGDRLRLDDGEATIIARLAGWLRSGKQPRLYEDGKQMRDWVYVGDIVAAVLSILNGASAPSIVNVCSGVPTPLTEACQAIAAAYGVSIHPKIIGGYRPGDMRHCLGDPTTLRKLLGRDPVRFKDGAALAFGPNSRHFLQGSESCAEFSSLTA